MKPRYATLGEHIYNKIEDNEYLNELYEIILYNYSMNLMGTPQRKKPLKKSMLCVLQTYSQNHTGNQTLKSIEHGPRK